LLSEPRFSYPSIAGGSIVLLFSHMLIIHSSLSSKTAELRCLCEESCSSSLRRMVGRIVTIETNEYLECHAASARHAEDEK